MPEASSKQTGATNARASNPPPGATNARVSNPPPGATNAGADSAGPGATNARASNARPGATNARPGATNARASNPPPGATKGGTERALLVLKELARHPEGIRLEQLSTIVGGSKSSVHRALAALIRADLAAHPQPGRYLLGSEFVRLAHAHVEAREEPRLVLPCLQQLSDACGETAHYGELEATEVVYLAKVVPAQRSVQMTSTIGGRNPAYCTGIGKALLAYQLPANASEQALLDRVGPLIARTPKTLIDPSALLQDLRATRERGYALDDEESELGINCIAFPLFLSSPSTPSGGLSISALRHRLSLESLRRSVEEIRQTIQRQLGAVLP